MFGWRFEDYGPEYSAFEGKGLMDGFYLADLSSDAGKGGALMVFYSEDLEQTERDVLVRAGRSIMTYSASLVVDVSILESQVAMKWQSGVTNSLFSELLYSDKQKPAIKQAF